MTLDPKEGSTPPDLTFALLVLCVECGEGVEVLLPIERDGLARLLAQQGWFLSGLTPPGQTPIVFGAICSRCAPIVYTPEIYKSAEARRQKMLKEAR